jgi:hypothetical protein
LVVLPLQVPAQIGPSIDVYQLRRIELDDVDVQGLERPAQRELPAGETLLERGQRAPSIDARQRPCRRDSDVRVAVGQPPEPVRREEGAVDREHDARVAARGAQSRDDARDRRAYRELVVDDRKRKCEAVARLSHRDPLVADLTEQAPGSLGERLASEARESLGRAEAATRPADQEDAAQSRTRHDSE